MTDGNEIQIPGPRPDYPATTDPEPWERFDGARTADNGVNLAGSGYRWNPRDAANPKPDASLTYPGPQPAPKPFGNRLS